MGTRLGAFGLLGGTQKSPVAHAVGLSEMCGDVRGLVASVVYSGALAEIMRCGGCHRMRLKAGAVDLGSLVAVMGSGARGPGGLGAEEWIIVAHGGPGGFAAGARRRRSTGSYDVPMRAAGHR
jgi:hypothetical protein